ncbi:T9SS type A sorting domain-containing protein [Mariniflexile maritimum]
MNLSGMPPGIYLLKIVAEKGSHVSKILKK